MADDMPDEIWAKKLYLDGGEWEMNEKGLVFSKDEHPYLKRTPLLANAKKMLEALKKHYRCPGSCGGKGYYVVSMWDEVQGRFNEIQQDCSVCREVRAIIAAAEGRNDVPRS